MWLVGSSSPAFHHPLITHLPVPAEPKRAIHLIKLSVNYHKNSITQ